MGRWQCAVQSDDVPNDGAERTPGNGYVTRVVEIEFKRSARLQGDHGDGDAHDPSGSWTVPCDDWWRGAFEQTPSQVFRPQYAVARDARFLINSLAAEARATSPITLILNWQPAP